MPRAVSLGVELLSMDCRCQMWMVDSSPCEAAGQRLVSSRLVSFRLARFPARDT